MIEWQLTNRGFLLGKFRDRYDENCSIQESSLATESCIWLGCDRETFDNKNIPCGARMHLTQEAARVLGNLLLQFANSGKLEVPT